MAAVLQNSRNSSSQSSNPSTARFLIDHIKRLVEDDMKFTVEAFKSIENEIDVELNTAFQNKKFRDSKTTQNRSKTNSVRSKNSSQKSNFLRQTNSDRRKSIQANGYAPSTTMYSLKNYDSRHGSLPNSHLQSNDRITNNKNYVDSNSCSQETKLHSQDLNYRENFTSIAATSTPNQHSFSSLQDGGRISRLVRSTDSSSYKLNGRNSEYQPYCEENPSMLQIVEAMHMQTSHERDVKEILNSILQKLNQFSNERRKSVDHSGLETINDKIYDESSYRRSANLSFDTLGKVEQRIPRFEPSAAADTKAYKLNGLGSEYQSYASKLQTVEAMHADFKIEFQEIMNRVRQKLSQCSNAKTKSIDKSDPESVNTKIYGDLPSDSLSHRSSSQISFGTSRQSFINNKRNSRKIILPQLLAFGDNRIDSRENVGGKGFTIIGERFPRHDRNYAPDEHTEKKDDAFEEHEKFDSMEKSGTADKRIEIVEEKSDVIDETEFNKSRKSSDSANKLTSTSDLNKLHENEANNAVTLDDVEDTVSKSSTRNTEKTGSQDDELTDAISSSLLVTPRTLKESSNEWTDLDEIALLISQASPNRRVIIKKKVPELFIKGFNKNCNEKLIFCGNKITHVKTDRKTMCRQYDPSS